MQRELCSPTSGVSAEDEFSDLIINKDEETVRESAEPPAGPEREKDQYSLKVNLMIQIAQSHELLLTPGANGLAYLSGYMRSATSMPGQ